MQSFTKEVVLAAASGHYNEIACRFLPMLNLAVSRPGRHVPDPFRAGSKDGFRVFKDFNVKGKMIFNQAFGETNKVMDVWELMDTLGISKNFNDALEQVGTFLGCERTGFHIKGTSYQPIDKKRQEEALAAAKQAAAKVEAEAKKAEEERYLKGEAAISKQLAMTIPLSVKDPRCKTVFDYFENRGLGMLKYAPESLFKDLRYSPRTPYFENGKVTGYYDALVSIVHSNNKVWTLHRIFLLNGQKAPVSSAKKVMTPKFDGKDTSRFIRLGDVPEHGIIGIAEGIETALSCFCGTRLPVWSAISATFLEEFTPPKNVKAVIIFADKDKSEVGQKSAEILRKRLLEKGIKAWVCLPKSEIPQGSHGIDWNDELKQKGVFGFPDPIKLFEFITDKLQKK